MAEKSTIARPYAQAVFNLANAQNDLKGWSSMLQFAAAVAKDDSMRALIGNPKIARQDLVDLFLDICADRFTDLAQNFIRVLVDNGRLNVLTEIAEHYEKQRAEAERVIDAEAISAFPLDQSLQQQLKDSLKQRLGREVQLATKIDESILGGVILKAGDLVIDASAVGQLERLSQTLLQ